MRADMWIELTREDGGTLRAYAVLPESRIVGYTDLYAAAVVWYGLSGDVDPSKAEIPVIASYGEDDAGIPKEKIEAFRDKLPVENDFKIYPHAGHAFRPDSKELRAERSRRLLETHESLPKQIPCPPGKLKKSY
jgi:dienelactone hydrolase